MRNNNADIVIHHLINRTENRKICGNQRIDSKDVDDRIRKKISIIRENQIRIEAKGHWKQVIFENFKYRILIREGKDEAKTVNHFISKLRNRNNG